MITSRRSSKHYRRWGNSWISEKTINATEQLFEEANNAVSDDERARLNELGIPTDIDGRWSVIMGIIVSKYIDHGCSPEALGELVVITARAIR